MQLPEEYREHLNLGAEIAFTLLIPIGVGYVLDKYLETSPYGMLIGAGLGIILFFNLVFKLAKNEGGNNQNK
ncbi:AtpZ/AtpI family protein [bacterium]|jgi:F0F1-type ATP synthase assembly protein I|nr:AtpZ/AtpI family protein [Balneola sp.]MBR9917604.1 AtpZ/AtpI family protein [bacterium]